MSDCGVCLRAGYDFGDNDFAMWNQAFKSVHECCECGRKIPAGEVHEKAKYRTDEFSKSGYEHRHTCAICAEIAWAFFCDSRLYGSLWDYMEDDAFENLSVACFSRLKTTQAKAELQRRWMQWKGLAA